MISLHDFGPSAWIIGDKNQTVAACALRGIAEVLDFDPRHLVGIPVNSPWNPEQRKSTALALSIWWRKHRGQPVTEAVAETAQGLPTNQALLLLMRVPPFMRSALLDRLLPLWAVKPPDLSICTSTMIAQLLALIRRHPNGEATVATWDLSRFPPLLTALWHSACGRMKPLDDLVNTALNQNPNAPTVSAQDPDLMRKLLTALAAQPTASRIAQLHECLRGSLDNPYRQQLLVALMIRSAWTDGFDALLPTAVETPGQFPHVYLSAPSPLYWALWSAVMDDQRPIPAGILKAITITSQGELAIDHLGGKYTDGLLIHSNWHLDQQVNQDGKPKPSVQGGKPKPLVMAQDLRVCDLMAWALLQQEWRRIFNPDDATSTLVDATINLTLPKSDRDKTLARLRARIHNHAVQHILIPLAPTPQKKDVSL